jgi:hypothetical protein
MKIGDDMFDSIKMKKLLNQINEYINKKRSEGIFSIMESKYIQNGIQEALGYKDKHHAADVLSFFINIADTMDSDSKIDLSIGEQIDSFFYDPDNTYFIHRTKLYLDENNTSDALTSIMEKGLRNDGHANAFNGAINNDYPPLGTTLTTLLGMSGYGNLVGSWHENDSIILVSIPTKLLNSDYEPINPEDVYYKEDGRYYIKPEYVIGNIVKKDGRLTEIDTKEDILNKKDIRR